MEATKISAKPKEEVNTVVSFDISSINVLTSVPIQGTEGIGAEDKYTYDSEPLVNFNSLYEPSKAYQTSDSSIVQLNEKMEMAANSEELEEGRKDITIIDEDTKEKVIVKKQKVEIKAKNNNKYIIVALVTIIILSLVVVFVWQVLKKRKTYTKREK